MRCLVFCDQYHDVYLELLAKYPAPDLEIIKVYACGGGFQSSTGIEIFPLQSIVEKETFDSVVILLSDSDSVRHLIEKVYGIGVGISFIDIGSFDKGCLSGAGQLELLRLDIALKCPSDHHLALGDFSYYSSIDIQDEINDGSVMIRIGKFCSIGPNVHFLLGVEHRSDWGASYPFNRLLGREHCASLSVTSKGDIILGNDVWIGADATILSGVSIGDGCVVGSNTVVSKSVEPYSIIVGNPGRVIKRRFQSDQVNMLMEMKWWDWEYQKIYNVLDIIQSDDIGALYSYWKRSTNENYLSRYQ